MLLFNLQKRWAEVDSLMEHLDSMGMDVCNVYKGQNVTDDIWDLSIEETIHVFHLNHLLSHKMRTSILENQ